MKNFFLTAIFFLFITINFNQTQAKVWEGSKNWTSEDWDGFSKWVGSKELPTDFLNSKYYEVMGKKLQINCADLAYGLMLWYAKTNGLMFSTKNISYNPKLAPKSGILTAKTNIQGFKFFSNELTQWDHIADPDKRFFAFYDKMKSGLETFSLATYDTYPIELQKIRPGDLYTWDMTDKEQKITRHTFVIKALNPDGTLDVFYSTQESEKNSLPPRLRTGTNPSIFNLLPKRMTIWGLKNQYGLSRFRPNMNDWGFQYTEKDLTQYEDYSEEQFELAAQLGLGEFFKIFKQKISQGDIPLEKELWSLLRNTCTDFKDRVKSVLQAEAAALMIQGCFKAGDFDAYSTPVGDSGKIQDFLSLKELYFTHQNDPTSEPELFKNLSLIFSDSELSESEKNNLLQICTINIDENSKVPMESQKKLTLHDIYKTLKMGSPAKRAGLSALHFNPNVSRYRRWGLDIGFDKKCWNEPGYYSYPDNFNYDLLISK